MLSDLKYADFKKKKVRKKERKKQTKEERTKGRKKETKKKIKSYDQIKSESKFHQFIMAET